MTATVIRRTGWMGAMALVAVMQSVVAGAETAPAPGGPGAAGVKRLLEESTLKFKWDDTNKVGTVSFTDVKDACSDTVIIYANDDAKGYYVMFNLCIVDKGETYAFPAAFLRKCLDLNDKNPIVKLGWNKKSGRIYASFGADMDALPSRIFKDYVTTMIRQGDRLAGELKAFLSAAEELATDAKGK